MSGTEEKEQEEELQLAHQLLTKIFCRVDWKENKEAQGRALELLKIYPSFASQSFRSSKIGSGDTQVPLCHFLRAGADLEFIKNVYHLHPDAVKTKCSMMCALPLHFACHTAKGTAESIAFLIDQHPEALDVTGLASCTPIVCYIKRCENLIGYLPSHDPSDLEVLSKVWDLLVVQHGQTLPASILVCPLREAFRINCIVMLEFLIPRIPEDMVLESFILQPLQFKMQAATILDSLLPSLKEVTFSPASIEKEALLHFLRSMAKNTSVTRLSLHLPNGPDGNYSQALADCLKENRCLIELDFSNPSSHSDADIHAIASGFRHNITIQKLTLTGYNATVETIADLLCVAPKTVSLYTCRITATEYTSAILRRDDINGNGDGCRIKELNVSNCTIPRVASFLKTLAKLPSLKQLEVYFAENLSNPPSDDDSRRATAALISILEQKKVMQMKFLNYPLDEELFCKHLETNDTLISVKFTARNKSVVQLIAKMLKNHNFTIQKLGFRRRTLRPWSLSREYLRACEEISHYTTLNGLGRKKAQSLTLTPREMTTLLFSAMETYPGRTITVFLYELLRESPSTWCDNAAKAASTTAHDNKPSANHRGTKRKRNDEE